MLLFFIAISVGGLPKSSKREAFAKNESISILYPATFPLFKRIAVSPSRCAARFLPLRGRADVKISRFTLWPFRLPIKSGERAEATKAVIDLGRVSDKTETEDLLRVQPDIKKDRAYRLNGGYRISFINGIPLSQDRWKHRARARARIRSCSSYIKQASAMDPRWIRDGARVRRVEKDGKGGRANRMIRTQNARAAEGSARRAKASLRSGGRSFGSLRISLWRSPFHSRNVSAYVNNACVFTRCIPAGEYIGARGDIRFAMPGDVYSLKYVATFL